MNLIKYLRSLNQWLLKKLRREYASSINPNQLAQPQVGSRFNHAAESCYAPDEGEALAVADALDKARLFVLGCSNLIFAVDHKPLIKYSVFDPLRKSQVPGFVTLKRKPCATNSAWCTLLVYNTELPMQSHATLLVLPTQTWCYYQMT